MMDGWGKLVLDFLIAIRTGGLENDFTNRNTTLLVWNFLHLARMLKYNRGVPAYGNLPKEWKVDVDSTEHKREAL